MESSKDKSDQQEDIKKAFEVGGIAEVQKIANEQLNKWKEIPLNVAITGRSGVGKSSLINALMGLKPRETGAAEVGVVETTQEVKSYPHPVNNNLIFHDLPGAGTTLFPRSTYLTREDIGFTKYDIFVIVAANRFMEDDIWLGEEIAKQKKPFVFVRSQIDLDLVKERKTNDASEEQTIIKIRKDCEQIFQAVDNAKVCLVDSYDAKKFDFDDLNSHMMASVPKWKVDAFVLAMSTTTASLIDEKEKVLNARIYTTALISAVGAAIPVPGLSMAIDTGIILKEIVFYQEQYGIPSAIQILTEKLKSPEVFAGLSEFSTAAISVPMLLAKLPAIAASEIAEKTASYLVPIVGSVVAAGVSYGTTVFVLKQILGFVTRDARKLLERVNKETAV